MSDTQFASVPLDELSHLGLVADSAPPLPLVLVVDDEPIIAETLALILKKEGFAVFAACGPERALEIARVAPPNLLLTDVVMPGMNGIELAIEMCKQVPDCRSCCCRVKRQPWTCWRCTRRRRSDSPFWPSPFTPAT